MNRISLLRYISQATLRNFAGFV